MTAFIKHEDSFLIFELNMRINKMKGKIFLKGLSNSNDNDV